MHRQVSYFWFEICFPGTFVDNYQSLNILANVLTLQVGAIKQEFPPCLIRI